MIPPSDGQTDGRTGDSKYAL